MTKNINGDTENQEYIIQQDLLKAAISYIISADPIPKMFSPKDFHLLTQQLSNLSKVKIEDKVKANEQKK